MNYIAQIKGFWIVAELHQLGHSEISLYFYLLEVWNKTTWAGQFKRQNSKVMGDLRIKSYKTLQSFRDKLAAAGVFTFRQRNGDGNVEYSMADLSKFYRGNEEEEQELGKNYRGFGQGSGKGSGQGSGNDLGNFYRDKINPLKVNGNGNDDDVGSPPSPPSNPEVQPTPEPYRSLEANKSIALADRSPNGFLDTMARLGLMPELLSRWLDAFHRQLAFDGVAMKTQKDYRKHFAGWIKFQQYRSTAPEDFSPVKAPASLKPQQDQTSLKTGIKML